MNNKNSSSTSSSSSKVNQSVSIRPGKWGNAHVRIAHMILNHQKQKNLFMSQQQQQRSAVAPTAPIPNNQSNPHANLHHPSTIAPSFHHHQPSKIKPGHEPAKLNNNPPNITTASASTFFPPIQSPLISPSQSSPFGGLASLPINSTNFNSSSKSMKPNPVDALIKPGHHHSLPDPHHKSSRDQIYSSSNPMKKSSHHHQHHHSNREDMSKSASLNNSMSRNVTHSSRDKPRSRSRSRSPLNTSAAHQQSAPMRHIHNQVKEKDKETSLPHHLQATEAAIIAAAQQHSLMDKYRQELMRLGMPPGLAPPLPPPAGFIPGLPPQAQPNPAHFPLNLPPLATNSANSSSTGVAPSPLSPLLTRTGTDPMNNAANPLLSPKSLPPMPPNMNEAEFLNIMRAMTAGNSPFSGIMPPFPPSAGSNPLAKNPNGLPPFLQQFFDNINQTSAKKEQPLAKPAISRENSSVSPNSASKKPRTLSPTEASQENKPNSPNKETVLEQTNKKEIETSEAKEIKEFVVEQEPKSGENEETANEDKTKSVEEDNENDLSSNNNSNNKLVIDDDQQQQKSKLENDSYLDEPSEQDISMNNMNKNEDETTQRPPQKDEASESQSDLEKGNKENEDETAKKDDDDDSPASLAINEENNANEEEKDTNDYESANSNEEDASKNTDTTTSANQTSQQLIPATNNCE